MIAARRNHVVDAKSVKRTTGEIGRRIGTHKIQTAAEMLTCYAFDATDIRSLPSAVSFPESTDDVREIVSLCCQSRIPVIPRGAGTGFAGGTVPLDGGMVISTERLNRILCIDKGEHMAIVQPGVINGILQKEAAKSDLMFPPDPSSLEVSTIGGNVAQDAGGPRALKYGVTRDYVLGVEFVTREGKMVECGQVGRNPKVWDPVSTLLIGSEGTLAIITKVCLRLVPRPRSFSTLLAFFDTAVAAAGAVTLVLDSGVMPAAVELIDGETMDCIKGYVDVGIPPGAGCSLLVETDGRQVEARDNMSAVEAVLRQAGAIALTVAESEQEREDLWKMRRSVSPSLARIAPYKINEDVCVPRSKLALLVDTVGKLARKYRLRVPTFGHAGDGNLHVNVMLDRHDRDQARRAEALVTELFEATMDLEGTISGEHGIGITKLQFLPNQLGADGWKLQNRVKDSFDPHSLINPGKVIGQT